MAHLIELLTSALDVEQQRVLELVPEFILPVVAKRNILLMREVSRPCLLVDLFLGMPQFGWAPRAPTMLYRLSPPVISIAELTEDADEHNQMIIKRTRASKDKALDWEAWRKTEEELALGILLGPFLSLDSVPVRLVRLIRRIGI